MYKVYIKNGSVLQLQATLSDIEKARELVQALKGRGFNVITDGING